MASKLPSGYRIIKVHPAQGQLQRYTLNKPLIFPCSKCQRTSMSSSVVTLSDELLCSRCYSQIVAPRGAPRAKLAKSQGAEGRPKPPQPQPRRPAHPVPRPGPTTPEHQGRAPAPSEGEQRPPKADANFVCASTLAQFSAETVPTIAVVETRVQPSDGMFGFAWVTRGGQHGQGRGRSANELDAAVQATCMAALQIGDTAPSVHVVTRNASAAAVVQLALRTGAVAKPSDVPLSDHTQELLREMAGYWGFIFVSADLCAQRHQGSAKAEKLAGLEMKRAPVMTVARHAEQSLEADRRDADGRLTGPDDEGEPARWLTGHTPKSAELSWRVALYRMHVDGEWCPLPDGRMVDDWNGRQLRLHLNHNGGREPSFKPVQDVTLRRRGGQWELAGVRWPRRLLPGTVVTFTWHPDNAFATAYTTRLSRPEQVDGLQFTHRYDRKAVTRETAPGAEQDVAVPDLSDASWVLRTLRKLGYLSADGEAILAEDALVRNCLELGLPPHRADRIHAAVEQLLRAHRLHRVEGSLDLDGRPWHPPRPGHVRTPLLQYVPRVEALPSQPDTPGEWQPHRRGHWVTGFVRRLPPGAQASAEQVDAHREAVRAAEVVDHDLPEGHTYVRHHRRGRVR